MKVWRKAIPLEYVSIGEYDLAVAVEALEISVGSGLDLNLAVPPSIVFDGKLERQEGGMWLVCKELCHSLKIELEYDLENY